MGRHQVLCIQKSNGSQAHDRISHIGGLNADGTPWKLTHTDAITGIEASDYEFYVSVNRTTVEVIIATNSGRKYLKTTNDGLEPNNLLSLPNCP